MNVQQKEEGQRSLIRALSCPLLSNSSNATFSQNLTRPQTTQETCEEKMTEMFLSSSILPTKRSCSEQRADEENNLEIMNRPPKRIAKSPLETPKSPLETQNRKRLSRSSTSDNEMSAPPARLAKQQSAALEKWVFNSIGSNRQQNSRTNEHQKGRSNLLSSFITYEDQLPPTPNSSSKYQKVSLPSPSSRGGRQRPCSTTNDSLIDENNDGVPMCLIKRISSQQHSSFAFSSKDSFQPSNRTHNFAKLKIVLRTFFVICSCLSFCSRCLIWFAKVGSILYNMIENPLVWIQRLYISIFSLALILVELGLGIPIVLPKGDTLSILTQRGFVQSFFGFLDLFMHPNMGMAETISILQSLEGELLTTRERREQISYAIISVSSRGVIVVGAMYFFLGLLYDDYSGAKKHRGLNK